MILGAAEPLDGFQQDSDRYTCFHKATLTVVSDGVWRCKKEEGDLAGATAGVRAGGLDQGVGRAGGEKQMEPRHITEVESTELDEGLEVGGRKRGESE